MAFTQSNFEAVLTSLGLAQPDGSFLFPTILCPDEIMSMRPREWRMLDTHPCERLTRGHAAIMVLESPHKDEFKSTTPNRWVAVGPLQNRRKFMNHFQAHVGARIAGLGVDYVVLVNAVQYACSRRLSLSGDENRENAQMRNKVFRRCWRTGARADFIHRLRAIYQPGDVVVNACTSGLKRLVEGGIMEALPGERRFTRMRQGTTPPRWCSSHIGTHHPSVWHGHATEVLWP